MQKLYIKESIFCVEQIEQVEKVEKVLKYATIKCKSDLSNYYLFRFYRFPFQEKFVSFKQKILK